MHLVVDSADAAADLLQRRAGVVTDLILGDDATVDLVRQRSERFQLIEIGVEAVGGILLCIMAPLRFYTGGGG